MASLFNLCPIWSMKAGVAVSLCCYISPPASCLAQVNGDTEASKHIQALLEFAPVGELDPGLSSSLLHGSYRKLMTPGYWSRNGANVLTQSVKLFSLLLAQVCFRFQERMALIVVWKLLM